MTDNLEMYRTILAFLWQNGMRLHDLRLQFAVDMAKAHHKVGILLTTWKDNYRAQNLYKKFGFELLGQDKNLVEYLMILNFPDPNASGAS